MIQKKGMTKKLFSAFLALAMVVTMLPASTMTVKADATPDVTLTASDIVDKHMFGVNGEQSREYSGITVKVNKDGGAFWQSGDNIRIDLEKNGSKPSLEFSAGDKKIKQIYIELSSGYKISQDDLFVSGDELQWGTTRSGDVVFGGEEGDDESYDSVTLTCPSRSGSYRLYATKIEFYLEDPKTTPTADSFTYDSSAGLVSTQTGIDLGTVTTYYKVNATWTTTKPTAVGTYEVGVVTAGSDTYEAIGSATEPFTASWTYEVKASGSGTDASGSNTKDTSGKVTITTDKQTGNFEAGGLKNTADELKNSVLTDADKKAVEAGKNVSVWVEMKDQTSTVSDSDKKAVADKLPTSYSVGTYLDINLWKQITGDEPSEITETESGNVKIGFTIPENLQKSGRTYKIIRIHDGQATILDATVDENYELTFETDRFSTYALVYTDSAAATGSDAKAGTTNASDTKANATAGSDAKASTAASTTTASPKTGDASNVALYLVILVAGIAGCAGVAFKRRKEF